MVPSTTNVGSGGGGCGVADGGGGSKGLRDEKKIGRAKTGSSCSGARACPVSGSGVSRSGDVRLPSATGSAIIGTSDAAIHPNAISEASRQSSAAMPMIAREKRLTSNGMTANRSIDVQLRFDRRLLRGQNARRSRRHAQKRLFDEQVGLPAFDRP